MYNSSNFETTEESRVYSRFPAFTKHFQELTLDMKPADVAKRLGLSRATIGFYLTGERIPDAFSITKIAKEFGVSADWLLGLSDVKDCNSDLKNVCDMLGLSPRAVLRLKEGHAHGDLITAFIDFFLSSDGPYQKLAIIFENLRTVLKYTDNSYYKLYDDDISLTDDGKITLSVDSANMLYTTRAAASMSDSVMKFCHRVCRYPSRFQQARKEGTNG